MNQTSTDEVTECLKRSVLGKCKFFVEIQMWGGTSKIDVNGWLQNFAQEELKLAYILLDSFIYFSDRLTNAVLYGAIQSLCRLDSCGKGAIDVKRNWEDFLDSAIVSHITGEEPNPTDSGYLFTRKARQILKIPEEQIKSPSEALELYAAERTPVIFVDDFVGSGSQCIQTWRRLYKDNQGKETSFQAEFAKTQNPIYYCPLIATADGCANITKYCRGLYVNAGHVLDESYNMLSPSAYIWKKHDFHEGLEIVERVSKRAGIEMHDINSVDYWKGFHSLGLALAFEHSVPDATLPIFRWSSKTWNPLVVRS